MRSAARDVGSGDAAKVKALLDEALPVINSEIEQFVRVLETAKWDVDAVGRIQSRLTRLKRSLQALGSTHPACTFAIAGVADLARGLTAFDRARRGGEQDAVSEAYRAARSFFSRSSSELYGADKALGCPYGCRRPRRKP